MAKAKTQTPQELYHARKEQQRQEAVALLPPGLFNHGNTCFMNSVLQGLIATRLLSDLVHFSPISPSDQAHSSTALVSQRSPLLTNGNPFAGQYVFDRVEGMPIGDVFLSVVTKAWDAQVHRRRGEYQSPKALLAVLGKKYDQYLDFGQQDAHEFLRILLDAMRMEEFDVIKKRQPPAPAPNTPSTKKGRRMTITPVIPEEDKLISMVDMIFGGKLTSVLVCQKCKHVSQTYEDFNDLSLSIKAEDYKEKKKNRLKSFAKKFTASRKSSNPSPTPPLLPGAEVNTHRPSSVPPPLPSNHIQERALSPSRDANDEPRRRSVDALATSREGPVSEVSHDDEVVESTLPSGAVSPDAHHIEFVEQESSKVSKKADGWTKLGRRVSTSLGLKANKAGRQSRSRDRSSRDITQETLNILAAGRQEEVTPRAVSSSSHTTDQSTESVATASVEDVVVISEPLSPSPRRSIDSSSQQNHSKPLLSHLSRSRSPRRPKPSRGESEYLSRIMADISVPSPHPLGGFLRAQEALSGPDGVTATTSSPSTWMKPSTGKLQSVEDCLKMFASVEILDGDNMVGCRRCWKIANGVYKPRAPEDDGEEESESVGTEEYEVIRVPTPIQGSFASSSPDVSHPPREIGKLPTSVSETALGQLDDEEPLPSLPSRLNGIPIPRISTTGPDGADSKEDEEGPLTARGHGPNTAVGKAVLAALSLPTPASSDESLLTTNSRKSSRPSTVSDCGSDVDSDDSSDEETDTEATSDLELNKADAPKTPLPPSLSPAITSGEKTPVAVRKRKTRPKPVIMRPAYKRYLVGVPPPVLVIHLKRFQQISTKMLSFSNGFKKLDDFISFPEYLDMAPFLAPKKEEFKKSGKWGMKKKSKRGEGEDGRRLYRLYAVVVHIGNMLGGHYVAYVALPPSDSVPLPSDSPPPTTASDDAIASVTSTTKAPERQWAYISDTVVRLTTREEVLKAKAYICMYERV